MFYLLESSDHEIDQTLWGPPSKIQIRQCIEMILSNVCYAYMLDILCTWA